MEKTYLQNKHALPQLAFNLARNGDRNVIAAIVEELKKKILALPGNDEAKEVLKKYFA